MATQPDQSDIIRSLLNFLREISEDENLKVEQTVDGRLFVRLLTQIDEEYFKQSMLAIQGDPIAQHGWVLNAARLKRIYLRLLSHFSFHLGLDPSRLLVPDCNMISRKASGWEAHWVRLTALIFYSLCDADQNVKLDEKLKKSPMSSPLIVNELSPPALLRMGDDSADSLDSNHLRPGSILSTSSLKSTTSLKKMSPFLREEPKGRSFSFGPITSSSLQTDFKRMSVTANVNNSYPSVPEHRPSEFQIKRSSPHTTTNIETAANTYPIELHNPFDSTLHERYAPPSSVSRQQFNLHRPSSPSISAPLNSIPSSSLESKPHVEQAVFTQPSAPLERQPSIEQYFHQGPFGRQPSDASGQNIFEHPSAPLESEQQHFVTEPSPFADQRQAHEPSPFDVQRQSLEPFSYSEQSQPHEFTPSSEQRQPYELAEASQCHSFVEARQPHELVEQRPSVGTPPMHPLHTTFTTTSTPPPQIPFGVDFSQVPSVPVDIEEPSSPEVPLKQEMQRTLYPSSASIEKVRAFSENSPTLSSPPLGRKSIYPHEHIDQKHELEMKMKEIEKRKLEIRELEEKMKDLEKENKKKDRNISILEERVNSLFSENSETILDLINDSKKNKEEIKLLLKEKEEFVTKVEIDLIRLRNEKETIEEKYKSLENDFIINESKINELNQQLSKVHSEPSSEMNCIEEIAVLEIELDSARAKLAQESDRADYLQKILDEQRTKYEALLYSQDEFKQEIEFREAALIRTQEETSMIINDLQSELKESEQQRIIQSDNIVILERMVESMDEELVQTQIQAEVKEAALMEDVKEASFKDELKESSGAKVRELEDLVHEQSEKIKALELELKGQKVRFSEQISDKENLIEDMKVKLSYKDESSPELVSQLETEITTKDDEIYRLESELALLAQSRKVLEDLERNLKHKDRQISDLEHTVEQLEEDLSMSSLELSTTIESDRIIIDTLKRDKEELLKDMSDLQKQSEAVEEKLLDEIKSLKKNFKDAVKLDEGLESQLSTLTSEHEQLKQEFERAEQKYKVDLERLNENIETFKKEKNQVEEEKEKIATQLRNVNLKLSSLEQNAKGLTSELNRIKSDAKEERESLKKEKENLSKQLNEKITALENSERENKNTIMEKESLLEEEISNLNRQLKDSNDKIKQLESSSQTIVKEKDELVKRLEEAKGKLVDQENATSSLQEQLNANKEHLDNLILLQERIEDVCTSLEQDGIDQLETSINSSPAIEKLQESFKSLKDLSSNNKSELDRLSDLEMKISDSQDFIENVRVKQIEDRLKNFEDSMKHTEETMLKLKKEHNKEHETSEEHKLILAAWHDLGLKIMKMKSLEKNNK